MAETQNDELTATIAKPAAAGRYASWLARAALCALVLFAYAVRRKATHPMATMVGPATVTEPERKFVGNWTTSRTGGPGVGIVILKADNRYVTICERNWVMTCDGVGKWFVRDNAVVWVYDRKPGEEDVNPIIEFTPDRFVIKEMNGDLTTLSRMDATAR